VGDVDLLMSTLKRTKKRFELERECPLPFVLGLTREMKKSSIELENRLLITD